MLGKERKLASLSTTAKSFEADAIVLQQYLMNSKRGAREAVLLVQLEVKVSLTEIRKARRNCLEHCNGSSFSFKN